MTCLCSSLHPSMRREHTIDLESNGWHPRNIISDLFPTTDRPVVEYGNLTPVMEACGKEPPVSCVTLVGGSSALSLEVGRPRARDVLKLFCQQSQRYTPVSNPWVACRVGGHQEQNLQLTDNFVVKAGCCATKPRAVDTARGNNRCSACGCVKRFGPRTVHIFLQFSLVSILPRSFPQKKTIFTSRAESQVFFLFSSRRHR